MMGIRLNSKKMNIDNVCRICTSDQVHLRDIHRTRIPKMMETCASVQVSKDDGLPANICATCFHTVTKLYNFKKKIENSDRIFRQNIKNKTKQRDILNIALTKADINENPGTENEGEISEEDIPLSQRLSRQNEEINLITRLFEEHGEKLTEGPPPLVPFDFGKKSEVLEQPALSLPEDTPPLIPIKPLVSITSLKDIVPKVENLEYTCNSCDERFKEIAMLREHKLTCQASELQCNICKKKFKERKNLIGHLKGHMVVKDYRCKICGKLYPNPSTFRVHLRTHTGEKPFRCPTCHKGFARWAGVVGHLKTHENIKPYSCETCGRAFKVASNLVRHKRLHTGVYPFSCSDCNKSFSQSENLQLHIRTYHSMERPYLCNECGKGFVNSTRLNRHMWIHSGYKPYVCQYCAKSYSNSNDLKNHERHHMGKSVEDWKPYACDVCDRKFFHSCRLAKHKKIHERTFYCHFCKKTFSSDNLLNKHLILKHGASFDGINIKEGDDQIVFEYNGVVEETKQEKLE